MSPDCEIIDTTNALHCVITKIKDESHIAFDTEFLWERTFYAKLALVQIGIRGGQCFLLDPLKIENMTSLGLILADPTITKIFHDAPQDLRILRRATNSPIRNVFDTRMAAGFAGMSSSLSLQNLVAEILDVEMAKGHTRSDWMARPLTPEQVKYAIDDVRYLIMLSQEIRRRTQELGVERWMEAELATFDVHEGYEVAAPEQQYLRISASSSLTQRSVAVLRELAAWREEMAKSLDKPRRFIAHNGELISIANVLPRRYGELKLCKKLTAKTVNHYGHDLMDAVKRGLDIPDADLPHMQTRLSMSRIKKNCVDEVVAQINICAKERHIDPQLVTSRNAVVRLLSEGSSASPRNHSLIRWWRSELLGDILNIYYK